MRQTDRANLCKKTYNNGYLTIASIASCFLILLFFLILILIVYICRSHDLISDFYHDILSIRKGVFGDMITAISTLFATIFAYCAYRQSLEMRRYSSFDAVFTQLLSSLHFFINAPQLRTYIIKDDTEYSLSNYFIDFSSFYRLRICKDVNCDKVCETQLGGRQIKELWKEYTDKNIVFRANFLNCFKYIYHIVDVVKQSPLKNDQKILYVGIIQSQLNLDILFCYFINIIASTSGVENEYWTTLSEYDFFRDLFNDRERYGNLIEETISPEIYSKFFYKNRKT